MKKQIRFFFVSDYLTPLVLAIQQYQDKIEKAVAIASESKKGKASILKRLIHSERSDIVEVLKLKKDGKDEFHSIISEVRPHILSWAEKNHDKELVFDITGGTKVMALVLYEIARELQSKEEYDAKISYTNTDANAFQWIGQTHAEDEMTVRLNTQQLLEASGHEVEEIRCNRKQIPERMAARRSITEELMARIERNTIGKLNAWASEARTAAKKTQGSIKIDYKNGYPTIPYGFMDKLQAAGALFYEKTGSNISSITFTDGEWASYLSGDWLEEWAWWQVHDIPELDGCSMGVTIKNKETKNELDLVLCCKNRLLVIEAKTAALSGSKKRVSKENDVIYKISDIAGKLSHSSYGTKVLLSWQGLEDAALKRARDGNLFVLANPSNKKSAISRPAPEELRKFIQEWVASGRLKRQS